MDSISKLYNIKKCILIKLKCINNDGSTFYKDYGIFKDRSSLLKEIGNINELINRKTNFKIDLSKEPDDFQYYLKDMFDREDCVVGYEEIEIDYYG
jgi:hypothetical protein